MTARELLLVPAAFWKLLAFLSAKHRLHWLLSSTACIFPALLL